MEILSDNGGGTLATLGENVKIEQAYPSASH
jgi:hypothetical protein